MTSHKDRCRELIELFERATIKKAFGISLGFDENGSSCQGRQEFCSIRDGNPDRIRPIGGNRFRNVCGHEH